MKLHLVDGTYELFRSFFGAPRKQAPDGREVGAALGLVRSMLALIQNSGATHIACAFDTVIESFRNDLYPGYKTGEGVDQVLLDQFKLAEEAVSALGIVVWSMIEFEADDAIASAVNRFQGEPDLEQIVICSPDKDLTQLVSGRQIVCWDRRREVTLDEEAIIEKYGVPPQSIPDYLALVGDSADGFPGVPTWGAKSTAAVLARYGHIEDIPDDPEEFGLPTGRAKKLLENLRTNEGHAYLFRSLATLRRDVPIEQTLGDLEWRGARERLKQLCERLGENKITGRVKHWRVGE